MEGYPKLKLWIPKNHPFNLDIVPGGFFVIHSTGKGEIR